jgi:hypothetical protein
MTMRPVIDTWMLQAVGGHCNGCTASQYEAIPSALQEAAGLAGVPVAPFQARSVDPREGRT